MPILAENKHRYPANWRGIREAILERAGNRCEQCGIPNHVWRHKVTGEWKDLPKPSHGECCDER